MVDPQANSNKSREARIENPSKEKVEKVVLTGEVIKKKKSLGRKFKDVFVGADARSVISYVVAEVLLPAAKNMIVDASSKGVERMMYGDVNPLGRRIYNTTGRPRVSYNAIRPEGYRDPYTRPPIGLSATRREQPTRLQYPRDDSEIIISSKEEAEAVLDRMSDILQVYNVVSVADLYDLIGIPSTHIDNKWGWSSLYGLKTRQVREGFLLELPPMEVIA